MAGRCKECATLIDASDNVGSDNEYLCKSCAAKVVAPQKSFNIKEKEGRTEQGSRISRKKQSNGAFDLELFGIEKGVLGGIVMIAIAAVWFFGGLAAGYIFFYPPILFIIGIFAIFKGIISGKKSSEVDPLDELLIEKGKDPDAIIRDLEYSRNKDDD